MRVTKVSSDVLRAVVCALAMICAAGVSRVASAEPPAGSVAAPNDDAVAPGAKPAAKPGAKAKPAPGMGANAKGGAHHPPHGAPAPAPMPYPGGMIERNAKRLGLSDETVKQMRAIVEMSRTENEKLRKRVEGEQGLLRKMLEQDTPDETAVMAEADKIGALVTEQRKNQLRAVLKIRSMLTPEQRAELEKIRKDPPGAARGK